MDIQRLELVRQNKETDAMLITDKYNMRYIAGYCGEGMLLYTPYSRYIITDSRYTEQAGRECVGYECIDIDGAGYGKTIAGLLSRDIRTIGFENKSISYSSYEGIKNNIPDIDMVPLGESVDELRIIKTEEEIANIKAAEGIGDAAFSHILECIKPGISEKEIALELEYFMKKNGADGLSFDTIAASGENSSMPHAIPTDRTLRNGDFLTMDFGCIYQGYCSDMTRTVGIGSLDSMKNKVYGIVLKAQEEALKAVKPGMKCNEIDKVARDIIREAGYGDCFGHGLGHSVGLFIHENPRFSPNCDSVLEPGMVITVEPGIYISGQFGVRIEDLIVVTENGYTNLTASEKKMLVV
ncbi:MAG: M24 family metallopeptidase [Coprococcus sp.]